MTPAGKAYLVMRRPDGLGNVFALDPDRRHILGRAKTNEVVLQDDLCSRQHAEVFVVDGRWRVRDCGSLNGTRVNDEAIPQEQDLFAGDEISVGRSRLLFVESLSQLPTPPAGPATPPAGLAIKRRLGQTRFNQIDTEHTVAEETPSPAHRHRISRDLSLLYRLALEMGAANTLDELLNVVLSGLLEATTADTAAVLAVKPPRQLVLLSHLSKSGSSRYLRLPEAISNEALSTGEAVLAENAARLRGQAPPDMYSVICAPVLLGDRIDAVTHLYCSDPMKSLGAEDLELVVAISKQFAVARQNLLRQMELQEENQRLKAQVANEVQLVGESAAIQNVKDQIGRVAGTMATVLLRGESGAGKELVARAIHLASPRRTMPFVCLNCAALPETLLESELFGHEKGSFTGATDRKIGKFEAASGGTIFLDEIGEMNLSAQAKLLRVLEGHAYERVGGSEPVRVNVRVVAATNRSLEEAVKSGQFRRDLYFRLQVVEIQVPPLRDRVSDIPLLAEYFLYKFQSETGRKIKGFTQAAMQKMLGYSWPGNVRELRNVVERAVALSTAAMIDAADIWLSNLDAALRPTSSAEAAYQPLSLEVIERRHITETLAHTNWNKSQAAHILGIERSTLDRKIKTYDIRR